MSKLLSTSLTGTPMKSEPGTLPSTTPTPSGEGNPGRSPAETLGTPGTDGCTSTDSLPDTDTSEDCDFEFIMQFGDRHPIAIVCNTHGWSAGIEERA